MSSSGIECKISRAGSQVQYRLSIFSYLTGGKPAPTDVTPTGKQVIQQVVMRGNLLEYLFDYAGSSGCRPVFWIIFVFFRQFLP